MLIDQAMLSQLVEQKMIAKNILLNYMMTMKDDLVGRHACRLFGRDRQSVIRSVDKSDSTCFW
ncbi:hypothetical protein LN96_09190 [Xanthomonas citri pv. citri]|uniref:Uncharacterized protein n=1 Tax=Xanthomonas floridensis TaxID=1843580 RepID=A0A1A9MA24_9XANT|nr:hypothetical protein A7D17_21385 [Xanthomonas floridensis]OMG05355.1 hypothetical protein LN96_09190 [Xanthomonas citri pv. citri]PIB18515.1 hypothetical protein AA099_22870 [Xanthomonas citri pv. citri]PWF18201.1 hypothetical protein TP38_07390 [Xanthomonas citri pv. citri]